MAKEKVHCSICGKQVGYIPPRIGSAAKGIDFITVNDGNICGECLFKAGMSLNTNIREDNLTLSTTPKDTIGTTVNIVQEKINFTQKFSPNKKPSPCLEIDENNKLMAVNTLIGAINPKVVSRNIFHFSQLISYEVIENGNTITSGGLGRAAVGGALLGGAGAIVGAVTGKKKTKNTCSDLRLRLTFKNAHMNTAFINFITTETKTNSTMYKLSMEEAQRCISFLDIILAENSQSSNQPQAILQQVSDADELLKYKKLLDDGILTQEEFEAKKKQILGI